MTPPLPSLKASVATINRYCEERHDGKFVCSVDPVKGRTLRATRDFAVGEILIEEPPLHAVRLDPNNSACTKLTELCATNAFTHDPIWYWCALNSVLVEDDPPVEGLRAISKRQWELLRILYIPEELKPSVEATCLVDAMGLQGIVHEIDIEVMIQVWLHNCFEHHKDPEGYIIYFMPSFCSHSCLPNALWCTDEDSNFRFLPRATIRAGDEVTLTYLSEEDLLRSTKHRRELLKGAKDFVCMCDRCVSPVDFSRGFRCPQCSTGVIYVDADVVGSSREFCGAPPLVHREDVSCGTFKDKSSLKPPAQSVVSGVASEYESNNFQVSDSQELGRPSFRRQVVALNTIWVHLLREQDRDKRSPSISPCPNSDGSRPDCPGAGEEDSLSRKRSGDSKPLNVSHLREYGFIDLSKTCALAAPETASRVLRVPRPGRCCMCHFEWTDAQQTRALAVEDIIEATVLRSEDSENRERSDLYSGGPLPEEQSCESSEALNENCPRTLDADVLAHQLLVRIEQRTLLEVLKKDWTLLSEPERRLLDSVIRLTFRFHWLVAHWFRFLESTMTSLRKLVPLDQMIWQYRNLYPAATPALAWAVHEVVQTLLSAEDNPELDLSEGFRQHSDRCIVSSYDEALFLLSLLFGSDHSFARSIVEDHADAVQECRQRVMKQGEAEQSGGGDGLAGSSAHLPSFYVGFCSTVLLSSNGQVPSTPDVSRNV